MAGKRSTTPLFDLLQQGRGRPVETRVPEQPPAPRRESAPERVEAPPPASPGPRARPEGRPPRATDGLIRINGGQVQMPLGFAAGALTLALFAVIGAWTLGYNKGEAEAKTDWSLRQAAVGGPLQIYEPGEQPQQGEPPRDRAAGAPDANSASGRGGGPGQAAPAEPAFLGARGPLASDPRRSGYNYLYLRAQLRRQEAEAAITMLADRGIEAAAAVDSRTLRRKDGPLYDLFAGLGFPSGEVGGQQARQYREQLLAAGSAWRQAGGAADFEGAYWKKH